MCMPPKDLNADIIVISRETVAECSDLLSRLRDAYSPVQKLDHFLGVVKAVLQSVSTPEAHSLVALEAIKINPAGPLVKLCK